MPANPEITAYIRRRAAELGIDPDIAVRVSQSEALNVFDPSKPDRGGDEGSSFGPFQLHYGGMSRSMPNAGMGDEFTKATGLDARNPSTWPQQVDFALQTAKRDGWRQWMGAANTGIPRWAGIKDRGASVSPSVMDGPKGSEQVQPAGYSTRPQGPVEAAGGGYGSDPANPAMSAPTPSPAAGRDTLAQTVAAPKEDKGSFLHRFAQGLGGDDSTFGAQGAPIPTGITNTPQAALAAGQATTFGDSDPYGMKRQQLASVMQRLNSGKLF